MPKRDEEEMDDEPEEDFEDYEETQAPKGRGRPLKVMPQAEPKKMAKQVREAVDEEEYDTPAKRAARELEEIEEQEAEDDSLEDPIPARKVQKVQQEAPTKAAKAVEQTKEPEVKDLVPILQEIMQRITVIEAKLFRIQNA